MFLGSVLRWVIHFWLVAGDLCSDALNTGQVFLVIFFWMWRISNGEPNPSAPRILSRLNRYLSTRSSSIAYGTIIYPLFLERYSPWQIILSTLTIIYGARNLDSILGLSGEPSTRVPVAQNVTDSGYSTRTPCATGEPTPNFRLYDQII